MPEELPLEVFLVIDDNGASCLTLGLEALKEAFRRYGDLENVQACCNNPPHLFSLKLTGSIDGLPMYSDGISLSDRYIFTQEDIDDLRREGFSFYRGGVIHA